jgi:hypothetical protein
MKDKIKYGGKMNATSNECLRCSVGNNNELCLVSRTDSIILKPMNELLELVLNGGVTVNYYIEKKREKDKQIERKIQSN